MCLMSTPNDIMVAGKQGLVELKWKSKRTTKLSITSAFVINSYKHHALLFFHKLYHLLAPAAKYYKLLCMPPNKEWKGKGSEMLPSLWG